MAHISPITASAFCKSIEIALRQPPAASESAARLRRVINGLPSGTLLVSNRRKDVVFYIKENGHQKYMSKKSNVTYALARKKYLLLLVEILELTGSDKLEDIRRRKHLIVKLKELILRCERGHLDIARIVLTSKQYRWFTNDFPQKPLHSDYHYESAGGLPLRSKSERDIANEAESLAVPFHYEERRVIYVKPLIDKLQEKLRHEGFGARQIYSFHDDKIHWIVPTHLEWMNAKGSVWKTYYPQNGTILIYNDFTIVLADDEIIIWEHEGMMDDFVYRCNASERAAVMKFTDTVKKENLIETFEQDIDTPEKLIDIIEREILPRLWF